MKRFPPLLLAILLILGFAIAASAAEIKTTGQFDFAFQWADNTNFYDTDDDRDSEDDFDARQRVRVQSIIAASENVSGTLYFEIGEIAWGNDAQGGALGTDGVNIETRRAYIDFFVPNTDLQFRIGLQGLALPAAVAKSPIMDDDVAAIVGSYAFNDMYSLTLFWARPYDMNSGDTTSQNLKDEFDMAGLTLSAKGDGFTLTPYGVYASIGKDTGFEFNDVQVTGDDATAWWVGTAFTLNLFDPFIFYADAMYGTVETDTDAAEATGWMLTGKLAYKMGMLTPTLTAWYASGDDDDSTDGTERLPVISPTGFAPTSFGFDAGSGIIRDKILSTTGAGMWGLVLAAEDISLIEDVTHTVRLGYYQGTNDKDAGIYNTSRLNLSEDDSAWEINVDTKYQIYENLAAAIELGWIKLDLDKDVWGANEDTEDAWRGGANLTYSF